MNGLSQPLQEHEIHDMKVLADVMTRVLRSYKLMLSFYGMSLIDEDTGLLDRSDYETRSMDPKKRNQSRYQNLVRACFSLSPCPMISNTSNRVSPQLPSYLKDTQESFRNGPRTSKCRISSSRIARTII